ncbi:hypothetical protein Mapa_011457 [Marchantia paleacea]|nr:hypothetical protein Mapa_011457 [Marchantia paleacea]
MAAAHSPLSSIIKTHFGLDGGDDFDSEPTSVLDLTQCISPPLQQDAWVEQQQQQAALWEQQQLFLWQQQQSILWEQQLWEEQQLCMWEQNESEMQYLYEGDQVMHGCEDYSTSYQTDGSKFQQEQQLQQTSSSISSLPSFDDYDKEAQFMLDSWISCSGNQDPLPSPTDADSDSSPYLALDGHLSEFDYKFQSEAYGLTAEEDENDAKFTQLVRENLEPTNSSHHLNQHLSAADPWNFLPSEDPLYQLQTSVPLLQLPSHPYLSNSASVEDNSSWYDLKSAAGANCESSVTRPQHPSSTVGNKKGLAASERSADKSRDMEEDCMSIISNVTAATKPMDAAPGPPCLHSSPPPKATAATATAVNANANCVTNNNGSGRVVTLAELASGGVKMGGVQLPNVGTQIPSVIRLAVETQSSGMGGVRMVQLLLACAEAVACRDSRQANILLQQLQHMATPYGDAMQRITACFVEGLTARLAITGSQPFKFSKPPGPRKPPSETEKLEGFQLVYRASPFLAFGHLAANSAILEAFEKEDKLHIVDLGMSHALQWPYLIHDLATRAGGPPRSLRITGFGLSSAQLKEAGEELVEIAKSRNIPFEFRAVTESLENMQRSMLELRDGEALAVNSVLQLHCVVKESRGSLNAVLQTIHELSPKILTLVEQDASHNGPFFLGRFMEALHYYSAIFDSLDVILPRNCPHRVKMEQFHFAEEIKNIVSCEGPARVERHERVDQWRRKMSRAGFQPMPLKFLSQARMWLSHYNCDGYTLSEEKGCLVMGWKGKPIIAASSWKR